MRLIYSLLAGGGFTEIIVYLNLENNTFSLDCVDHWMGGNKNSVKFSGSINKKNNDGFYVLNTLECVDNSTNQKIDIPNMQFEIIVFSNKENFNGDNCIDEILNMTHCGKINNNFEFNAILYNNFDNYTSSLVYENDLLKKHFLDKHIFKLNQMQ